MKTGDFGCLFGVYTEDYIDLIKKQASTQRIISKKDKAKVKTKIKGNGKTIPKK